MNSFRVKHVVNEVAGFLAKFQALPNFDQHAFNTCKEVATLLVEGKAGYDRLNITANDYDTLRTSADLIQHAVLCAASRWNVARANNCDAPQFFLHAHQMSAFVSNIMTDYEVYFQAHPAKLAVYAQRYQTVDAILAADADVEVILRPDRPCEMITIRTRNGRFSCGRCNKTMASMEVMEVHHNVAHLSGGGAACTECTWTRPNRPADVYDHMQAAHDIYRAGHPEAYSTSINHISRKTMPLLKRLLVEERATLARLRHALPPPAVVPSGWNARRISLEISRIRTTIKTLPGWRAVVGRKRARRVAQ